MKAGRLKSKLYLTSYGIPILAVGLVVLTKLALHSVLATAPFLLFFGAVMFSAFYGGFKSGLFATCLALIAVGSLFLPPLTNSAWQAWEQLIALMLFSVEGFLVSNTVAKLNTTRKHLQSEQQALRNSELRFRTLIEQSPQAILIFSTDGTAKQANRAWEKLWDIKFEDIGIYNLLQDKQVEALGVMPLIKQAFAGESVVIPAIYYDPPQTNNLGAARWVESNLYPVKNEVGAIQEIVMIVRDVTDSKVAEQSLQNAYDNLEMRIQDRTAQLYEANQALQQQITERQQAELALQESERRFRAIFNQTFQFIGLMQLDGILLEANQTALDFAGLERSQVIGLPFWEAYWWTISPETQANLKAAIARAAAGEFIRYEVDVLGAEGTVVTIDFSIKPIRNEAGTVTLLIPEGRDITNLKQAESEIRTLNAELEQRVKERTIQLATTNQKLVDEIIERERTLQELRQTEEALRQSEQRFRLAVDNIPDTFVIYDAERRLQFVNAEGLRRTQQPLSHFVGRRDEEIHPPEITQGFLPTLVRTVETLTPQTTECTITLPTFGTYTIVATYVPLLNEQGELEQILGITHDITERKHSEEMLQQQSQELALANRLKDEFLATISHELRTPLNSMLGWAKLLPTRTFNAETTTKAIESIARNTQNLAQLIEDVLDMSDIIRGRLELQATSVDLALTIEQAISSIHVAADAKQISIHSHLDFSIGLVLGDAARLQQVVWNLLSNAVKFTQVGGQIDVYLLNNGDWIQIKVKDNGKGIVDTFLPYVFDRFRQEDNSSTRSYGGLGLGLAITRYLVELHGGTIQAESPGLGQGATFTVHLPLFASSIHP